MIPEGSKVFVVDDDPTFTASLLRLLQSANISAEAFGSAREFLAHAVASGPACVLVDLRMPEVDGLELQDALDRSARKPAVVFISGAG